MNKATKTKKKEEGVRYTFRCTRKEKETLEELARQEQRTIPQYILDNTVYKKTSNVSSSHAYALGRQIMTYVNQIEDGVELETAIESIKEAAKRLCQ